MLQDHLVDMHSFSNSGVVIVVHDEVKLKDTEL